MAWWNTNEAAGIDAVGRSSPLQEQSKISAHTTCLLILPDFIQIAAKFIRNPTMLIFLSSTEGLHFAGYAYGREA